MSLPSRSKTPTSPHNELSKQSTALNDDSNSATNTHDNQDLAEDILPESMQETNEATVQNKQTDQALEAALQEAVRAEPDSHSHEVDKVEIEVLYAPDLAQLAPELPAEHFGEDNRSPEYSLELNRSAPEVTDRESDGYEPPDATAPTEAPESPPFSPAPPESTQEEAVDESMQEINSTQALSEDEIATADTSPTVNSAIQVLLEVNGFYIYSNRPRVC
jgi:hypothetical protein